MSPPLSREGRRSVCLVTTPFGHCTRHHGRSSRRQNTDHKTGAQMTSSLALYRAQAVINGSVSRAQQMFLNVNQALHLFTLGVPQMRSLKSDQNTRTDVSHGWHETVWCIPSLFIGWIRSHYPGYIFQLACQILPTDNLNVFKRS